MESLSISKLAVELFVEIAGWLDPPDLTRLGMVLVPEFPPVYPKTLPLRLIGLQVMGQDNRI